MKVVRCLLIVCVFVSALWAGGWFYLKKHVNASIAMMRQSIEAMGGEFETFSYTVAGFPLSYDVKFMDLKIKAKGQLAETLVRDWYREHLNIKFPTDIVVFQNDIAFDIQELSIQNSIWSPLKQKVILPKIRLHTIIADNIPFTFNMDGTEINFINHQFRSLFCEHSCSKCADLRYVATKYSIENDNKGKTSFACTSVVFDVCDPSGQDKVQMLVGPTKIDVGPLPFDSLYAFQNIKFSLVSFSENWFVEFDFPRVEVVSNVEIKEGKALMNRVAMLKDSTINFSILKRSLTNCNIELIETQLQGSCSEEKLKEYQNINWATFFENCKAVALKHAYAGRKNVPELKDLISAIDVAQVEGKLNVKLVYKGHESSIALSGGITNLFPEGELSIAIAKDSCPPNLIEEIEKVGLQDSSGYYRTKFELKDHVILCDGMTLHTCDPVDWESIPVLTKDTCVDFLGMSIHDYCKYLE